MKIFGRAAASSPNVDRRQDSAVHRHQMRRKGNGYLSPRSERKLLVELGHVPMMSYAVSVKAFRDFREQHGLFCSPPRPGHSRLGIDDDFIELDRLVLEQGNERKLRTCCVAAGIGDQSRFLDVPPVNLGEPVDGLLLELGCVML